MVKQLNKIILMGVFFITSQFIILALFTILTQFTILNSHAAEEEKAEDLEAATQMYIHVPPVAVTMYHRGRPKGNMTITLLVKLVNDEKRATATKSLPRLSSAYMMEAGRLSHDFFDVTRPVNVGMLGDALQLATNRTLGHKEARVLISDVIINKR